MQKKTSTKPLRKTIRNQKDKNKKLQKEGSPMKVYNLLQEIDEHEKDFANGEQFTKCQKCGDIFEQDYRADVNIYSNHKTCHKCRWKKAKNPVTEKETEIQISSLRYTPYPWQLQFHKDCEHYRRIVMACGSRCFTANNFIAGCNKYAKDLVVGDKTINKYGALQDILEIHEHYYDEEIIIVESAGGYKTECSKEHGFEVTTIEFIGEPNIIESKYMYACEMTWLKINNEPKYYLRLMDENINLKLLKKGIGNKDIIVIQDKIYSAIQKISSKIDPQTIYSVSTEDESIVANGTLQHNSGKNRSINMQFISDYSRLLNENRHIEKPELVPSIHCWFIAPTEPMALQNWREMKAFFPKEWIVSISESTKTIETIGGGIIEIRSAYNPESLVGVALDFCNITEGARVKDLDEVVSNIEDRLNSPDRGIEGKGGRLIVDSSPLRKNYFYKMWTWGQKNHPDYDSNWISYQVPSTANPEIARRYAEPVKTRTGEIITYEESLRRRKGKKFLQDNMAQFLDAGGTVFPDFKTNCVYDIFKENSGRSNKAIQELVKDIQEPQVGEKYRIGYDPASGSGTDNPAIVVRRMSDNHIIKAIDLYGKYDDAQLDEVARIARYYNNADVCALTTAMYFLAGQLEKRGISVIDCGEQGQKKKAYISCLQTVISNRDVTVIDDGSQEMETLIFQMEDYTENEKTGKFGNETQPNDDYVSAMYAVFHDYLEVPEIQYHFMNRMKGIGRRSTNGSFIT